MTENQDITIPKPQINAGGTVSTRSVHTVLVEGEHWHDWHQGAPPKWKNDNYAEYLHIGEDWSLFDRTAHRVQVELHTWQGNVHRSHDWKGFDEVVGRVSTMIVLNGIQSYEVRYNGSLLRHLVEVATTVERLLAHPAMGWWPPDLEETLVGKEVQFKGLPATVERFIRDQGSVVLAVPGLIDPDGYYDPNTVKDDILSPSIQWWRRDVAASATSSRSRSSDPGPMLNERKDH